MPPIKKATVKSKTVSEKSMRTANVRAARVGASIPFANIPDPFDERVKKEKGSPDLPITTVRVPKGKF